MLEKQYNEARQTCTVTFTLPEAIQAERACLVGEFNDWDAAATPMTRGEDGIYRATLDLEPGREYQFRYLVDGERWHNGFGEDNGVVVTPGGESVA
ncbi:MAG TPA: isoamylase early set domain-containing protein [Anaerolineae bacterium]|nr:isoamylase early set domain-containing protein [Anaerolineae bacterium]